MEEMLQKRQEYKEKTKGALIFTDFPSEKKKTKRRRDDYVSDNSDSSAPPGSPSAKPKVSKPKKRKR